MEHEVYVPHPAAAVRAVFTEPERIAACVPGFQPEPRTAGAAGAAEAEPERRAGDPAALAGRLRLRIGGSTITYRGALRLLAHGEGFLVDASGEESRGNGRVRLTLTVVPRPVADGTGTTLAFAGVLEEARGRITEFDAGRREAAGRRLLDRFTEALLPLIPAPPAPAPTEGAAPDAAGDGDEAGDGDGAARQEVSADADAPSPDAAGDGAAPAAGDADGDGDKDGDEARPAAERGDGDTRAGDERGDTGTGESGEDTGGESRGLGLEDDNEPVIPGIPAPDSGQDTPPPGVSPRVFDAEVPPSSLDPDARPDDDEEEDGGDGYDAVEGLHDGLEHDLEGDLEDGLEEELPEADAARRAMIGRSAEEVDHAPPRGRYAPVPGPGSSSASRGALRWAAPVAALAIASAVAVTRALRRRR
ncbi:hypothetical protein [Streptomyces sp. YIM 98790]|uniref:hypothetical protein n=1 Tax=Streptomyces sp. YIM 98790 TaxID=2689077 RepID=UPI00140D75DE|nr:hypothetical protein [Streptomyces sp. YIM 98790]